VQCVGAHTGDSTWLLNVYCWKKEFPLALFHPLLSLLNSFSLSPKRVAHGLWVGYIGYWT
jgi:hypothetical protein